MQRLNDIPFLFAPDHIARELAPGSWEDLRRWSSEGGRIMPVYSGASDKTLWGTRGNHAFRAWHDAGHLALGAPFTLEGEKAVGRWQCAALERRGLGRACRVVWWEVAGQAAIYEATGAFPLDQIAAAREAGVL